MLVEHVVLGADFLERLQVSLLLGGVLSQAGLPEVPLEQIFQGAEESEFLVEICALVALAEPELIYQGHQYVKGFSGKLLKKRVAAFGQVLKSVEQRAEETGLLLFAERLRSTELLQVLLE